MMHLPELLVQHRAARRRQLRRPPGERFLPSAETVDLMAVSLQPGDRHTDILRAKELGHRELAQAIGATVIMVIANESCKYWATNKGKKGPYELSSPIELNPEFLAALMRALPSIDVPSLRFGRLVRSDLATFLNDGGSIEGSWGIVELRQWKIVVVPREVKPLPQD